MWARNFTAVWGGVACLLVATVSRAQCTMDNDCPGELVCEAGACAAAKPSSAAAPAPNLAFEAEDDEPRERRRSVRGKRHSTAMMVSGIVLTSLAPMGFLAGTVGALGSDSGLFVGGYVTGGVLAGIGIPLIVIGGKREPLSARLTPWVSPHSGGLCLGFQL